MACEFDTVDYQGVPVRCAHQRWDGHILGRHPYMAGQQGAVVTALSDPYMVYQSGRDRRLKLYYRPLVLSPPYTQDFLIVVVKYPSGDRRPGRVITAYKNQTILKGDTLIWEISDART